MASILDPLGPYITGFTFSDDPAVARTQTISGYINTVRTGPRAWTFNIQLITGPLQWTNANQAALYYNIKRNNRLLTWPMKFDGMPVNIQTPLKYKGSLTPTQITNITPTLINATFLTNITLNGLPANTLNCIPQGTPLQFIDTSTGKISRPVTALNTVSTSAGVTSAIVALSDAITVNTISPTTPLKILLGTDVTWNVKFAEIPEFGLNNFANGIFIKDESLSLIEDLGGYTL